MVTVGRGLAVSLGALVGLLSALLSSRQVGLEGWGAGLVGGVVLAALVATSAARRGVRVLGPADVVTVLRATLTCAVAALVVDSFTREAPVRTLAVLAATSLALDAVDGRVARGTGTVSSFGARLDGEADAALMLVLSVDVARSVGLWVLAIGGVRYAFAAAGVLVPWLRATLPFRYWRKVVAASAGIALTVAAARVVPVPLTSAALAVAALLLAESFGRDVWWLSRRRRSDGVPATGESASVAVPSR
jgi:phosphatidylglycerophosphate synthase